MASESIVAIMRTTLRLHVSVCSSFLSVISSVSPSVAAASRATQVNGYGGEAGGNGVELVVSGCRKVRLRCGRLRGNSQKQASEKYHSILSPAPAGPDNRELNKHVLDERHKLFVELDSLTSCATACARVGVGGNSGASSSGE